VKYSVVLTPTVDSHNTVVRAEQLGFARAWFFDSITVAAIGTDYADADVDGQWAQVREIADDGAVLVRPDNHVAWRSIGASGQAADILIEAVGAILGR